MEIIYNRPHNSELVLTIGSFDGIHLGHREIMKKTIQEAERYNSDSALLTFNPHPLEVVAPAVAPKSLTSYHQKLELIEKFGINRIIFKRFTEEFAQLPYQEFIKKYLVDRFSVNKIIVGADFRCGHQSKGTPEKIKELGNKYGFEVEIIPAIKIDDQDISSTYIRELIKEGAVSKVKRQLGRNFKIEAKVVSGDGRGRELGYPTANLKPVTDYVIPSAGVYACRIKVEDELYDGVVNLGYRPTFNKGEFSIEVNIFDFSDMIYEQTVELEFVERIRGELDFSTEEELIEYIEQDVQEAKEILSI
ncbi:bifunctional riboflavin kinase/FAD synthetase [Halanaerobacter jeridensis]|uniref:Riboflavin biosynthesis protein n=1 Tax=Halanaerobacter jeridensis TaxID=706427 RepID=A0A938XPZ6_9FIRM|nr:bifunctional riboflavin kinase/FAD synthetase [Halanaerobacter jeridensis]MBM7555389.1 riboflavin kinase/FMN adenylyltransferase [Halanaerobacter jeridensis]